MTQFTYSGALLPTENGYLSPEFRSADALKQKLLGAFSPAEERGYALALRWGSTALTLTGGTAGDGAGGPGAPITPTTRFRLASVTKQFIARGIIALAEAGRLSFRDSIRLYFPILPEFYAPITVEMMLRHTSGLPDYEDMPDDGSGLQVQDTDLAPYLAGLDSLYFTPGSAYRYSNTAYVLLGLIIEAAAGLPLPEAMQKYVFAPAGLTDTLVNIQGVTRIPERAYGHVLRAGTVTERDQYRWSATVGDGGLYSDIEDLLRWEDSLAASEEALSGTMFCDTVLPDGSRTGYGMGIRLRRVGSLRFRCHTGITVGFNSAVVYSPDLPFRAAFLTNLSLKDPAAFIDAALETVFGSSGRNPGEV